jgi:hypothetical protein
LQELLTKNMVGKAAKFILKENDPFRIFGLPKNMLLEVCVKVFLWTIAEEGSSAFCQNHVPSFGT